MTEGPWTQYQEGPWTQYQQQESETEVDAGPSGMLASPTRFTEGMAEGFKRGIVGAADLALTGITAGAAEIASGYAGLIALGLSGGDVDYAAERVRKWQDALTRDLKSDDAKEIIQKIAPTMSKADTAITNFAEEKSNGNPAAATAIKTLIYGGLDIAGAIIPLARPLKDISKIKLAQQKIIRDAKRLGININLEDFADDVVRVAGEIGSSERGAMAGEYVQALRNAEYMARLKKNSKYLEAMDADLNVETTFMRDLQTELLDPNNSNSLLFKYDLDDMPKVVNALNKMDKGFFSAKNVTAEFKRVEGFRKQLNAKIKSAKGSEKVALIDMKNTLDAKITTEFNNAMLKNGQSALSGDPIALETWLDARKLAQQHAWFNENRVISDLIKKGATGEQVSTWVIGASASGGKKQAAMVINKIKDLLGENHPAIDAIRQDFIYEVMKPLLQNDPNLKTFLNRYSVMMRENHSVVDALGIRKSDAEVIRKFATVAQHLPKSGQFYSLREVIQAFSQVAVGHEVAQGAARVKLSTRILNMLGGVDQITEGEILRALDNVYLNEPIIPSNSAVAAGVTAAAAISGSMDENE